MPEIKVSNNKPAKVKGSKWLAHCVGKRKTAVARVFIRKSSEGKSGIIVNREDYKDFFKIEMYYGKVIQPLVLTGYKEKDFYIFVTVKGGGISAQAEAVRLGIAKCLVEINPENRAILKNAKLLTRDSRKVQRKMFGHKKARKSFQFTKR